MERLKPFTHYVVVVRLLGGRFWLRFFAADTVAKTRFAWPRLRRSATKPSLELTRAPKTTHLGFNSLKTITCNGHQYRVDKEAVFSLHGWYPWLKENPWNAWRQVYNMIYRWWHSTGLLVYREPGDQTEAEKADEALYGIAPVAWPTVREKWTPALVRAVNLSRLEERYNRQVNYGGMAFDWKIVAVVGLIAVFVLLYLTGRLIL